MVAIFLLPILLAASQVKITAPGPHVAHRPGVFNPAREDRLDSYWRRAQQEDYRSPEELAAQIERDKRRGRQIPLLMRGNPREKIIALTFDDGPHPETTRALLAILAKEKVKATFFVIGFMVERDPDLVHAEALEGHEIGNHTFSHVTLTHLPTHEARTEYRACSDLIKSITGKYPAFCRPPGGDYDARVVRAGRDVGMTTVLWTDDPGDYADPGTGVIAQRTLDRLSNGGIVLLHDGAKQTLLVLPQIIEHAKKKGFRFVRVSELESSATARLVR
ncbi:MAG: polysaccharide deacetylase family protein [Fimbriimonas ginsengisoli]|uniref:Polysaccharide deacetylase family protein n=1 Tax=Fimbriimonas ginsengisoli TaxID=1005039 RepID=A0A931LRN0_FIMGI|nr:polysaccharide deacetylase family protein [Fimbriimonas ginsengisoli]